MFRSVFPTGPSPLKKFGSCSKSPPCRATLSHMKHRQHGALIISIGSPISARLLSAIQVCRTVRSTMEQRNWLGYTRR